MARLFASLEEDLVQDLDDVESSVATDGPEDNESDLTDPVAETSLEQYKDIKSAVEEALEVQEEVQDQINKNEEVLEENPESVSEEVIAESRECLIASLSKLGLSKDSLVKYRISGESFKSNSEKLVALNKKLKLANETITRSLRSAIMQSYAISDRKFGISQEYNAMDWPQFFLGGINTAWRALTNKSKTKIDNPGALVSILTGKWTTFGQLFNLYSKTMQALGGNPFALGDIISQVVNRSKGQGALANLEKDLRSIDGNIYRDLIVDCKKVTPAQYEALVNEFKVFKDSVRALKAKYNKPCTLRPMNTTEIAQIKLFKPEKANKEIANAVSYFKGQDLKLAKLAEEVGAFVGKEIVNFIIENTVRDV